MIIRCNRCGSVEDYKTNKITYVFCHACGCVNRVEKKDKKKRANTDVKIKENHKKGAIT